MQIKTDELGERRPTDPRPSASDPADFGKMALSESINTVTLVPKNRVLAANLEAVNQQNQPALKINDNPEMNEKPTNVIYIKTITKNVQFF